MTIDLSGFAAFARRVGAVPLVPLASSVKGNGVTSEEPAETLRRTRSGPRVPLVPPSADRYVDGPAGVDTFDEHAAIAEHDGGLPRTHAEVLAALATVPFSSDRDVVLNAVARRLDELTARNCAGK